MNTQNSYTISKKLFGGEIEFVIASSDDTIGEKIDAIYQYGLALQKIYNFYDPTSELSQLNRNRSIDASPSLHKLIIMALSMCTLTQGSYDISLGKYIIERKLRKPLSTQQCSYKDIEIIGQQINLLHPDVMIDLGSIAKGYITDCLADRCRQDGLSGLIDSRGDILAFGDYKELIGIQDPREADKEVGQILLHQNAVATSGDYKQYDTQYNTSHILHQKAYSSMTVISSTLTQADMIATGLFVSDEATFHKILAAYNTPVLCITSSGTREIYNDPTNLFIL